MQYVGDLYPEDCVYGGLLPPDYHKFLTKLLRVNTRKAKKVPGVIKAKQVGSNMVAVYGDTFTAVQEGLKKVKARWKRPGRSTNYDIEKESRKTAKFAEYRENVGDPALELSRANFTLSETYFTHHMTHCPVETNSAVATVSDEETTVWVSSQYPFGQRRQVAKRLKIDEEKVHVVGMQVGGGYGGKIVEPSAQDTATLSKAIGKPVKYIYNREEMFTKRGRAKEPSFFDITSGLDSSGRYIARTIDIFNDVGYGSLHVYDIPHSRTRLYECDLPLRHAVIRGTSYIQTVFAVESHIDDLAHAIGVDPLDFRLINITYPAYEDLLQAAAEMIGYASRTLPDNTGIGMALVNHGSDELGAVFAEVTVNSFTGGVTVNKITGAFDVGTVMNRRTLTNGVRGAIMWGIGYGLLEELELDGHKMKTRSMWQYEVPRFRDVPDIEVKYFKVHPHYGGPRGAGEMPSCAVAPAIGNAIRQAVGVRLHRTPFTEERILAALED
jgi:isoquinoline 1-oxidoreductase